MVGVGQLLQISRQKKNAGINPIIELWNITTSLLLHNQYSSMKESLYLMMGTLQCIGEV